MQILFVTDIHGDVGRLPQLPPADLVILGGDLTTFGTIGQVRAVLEAVRERYPRILAVAGNCDPPEAEDVFRECDADLHLRTREVGGTVFAGIGGSNVTPANTPNEWEDEPCAQNLRRAFATVDLPPGFILVSHPPPHGSGADRLRTGAAVGSRAVSDFVRERRPALVLCGHIHEAPGVFRDAGVTVVNPGAFAAGAYARVRIEAGRPPEVRIDRLPR